MDLDDYSDIFPEMASTEEGATPSHELMINSALDAHLMSKDVTDRNDVSRFVSGIREFRFSFLLSDLLLVIRVYPYDQTHGGIHVEYFLVEQEHPDQSYFVGRAVLKSEKFSLNTLIKLDNVQFSNFFNLAKYAKIQRGRGLVRDHYRCTLCDHHTDDYLNEDRDEMIKHIYKCW